MKRTLVPLTLAAAAILVAPAAPGAAYTPASDAVVFRDACDDQLYFIRPDGSGRRALGTRRMAVTDVSTGGGPPTALATGPSDPSSASPSPSTLYAIDPDGVRDPVALLAAGDLPAGNGAFSPDGLRIAYVHHVADPDTFFLTALEVVVGDVVRDGSGAVTGLENVTTVADLLSLGRPSDTEADPPYLFTGLDFARDGRSIVTVVYDDLWRIFLAEDGHAFAGAVPLTRTTDFAERSPRWSPVADVVAFEGGPYTTSTWDGTVNLSSAYVNVYTLDVSTGLAVQVTTSRNKGPSGSHRHGPAWSPDGRALLFSAQGQGGKRNQPCNGVNYDLFRIPADGSAKAVAVTNTAGTGIESAPAWGWSE